MPHALLVHIGKSRRLSLDNLDLGLSHGRWAFPPTKSPDLDDIEIGDLIFFGVGGGPRVGGREAGWYSRTLSAAYLARIISRPFINKAPFWLDELKRNTVKWNPTLEIEFIRNVGPMSLEPGRGLSFEATNALYRGAVSHQAWRIPTEGSPALAVPPSSVLPGLRPRNPLSSAPPHGDEVATATYVKLESPRLNKMLVKARAATIADPAESDLVHRYAAHLGDKGIDVGGSKIRLPDGTILRCDLLCPALSLLVEAKASARRSHIRMAIGQLFDYGRAHPAATRAVLVPEKPPGDLLELLETVGFAAIWPERSTFADTRQGAFC